MKGIALEARTLEAAMGLLGAAVDTPIIWGPRGAAFSRHSQTAAPETGWPNSAFYASYQPLKRYQVLRHSLISAQATAREYARGVYFPFDPPLRCRILREKHKWPTQFNQAGSSPPRKTCGSVLSYVRRKSKPVLNERSADYVA